jgi:hypothetical protein
VACNFQTENNNIKLLTEYENVTQKVVFGNAVLAAFDVLIDLVSLSLFRKKFYFVFSGLKIIDHGNPDNNLESLYLFYVPSSPDRALFSFFPGYVQT